MRWLILALLSTASFGQIAMPVLGSSGGSASSGSFAFVAQQTGSGANMAATCATGELCVFTIGIKGATGTVTGVTDSTGDTWTQATNAKSPNNGSSNETFDVWYLSQPAHNGSRTLTPTFGGSGSGSKLINQEFTGQASSSVLDTCTTAQGTSTNPSVSITAGTSNELLLVEMVSTNGSATAGSGFTMASGSPGATNFFEYWERNLASASGSNTAGFTQASSIDYSISACLFKHS